MTTKTDALNRPELPPTTRIYFYQAEGDPTPERVLFALEGICATLDLEGRDNHGDFDKLNRLSNLEAAAAILAAQLADRITTGPNPAPRRKPRLRAVPAGMPGGAA